MDNVALLLLVEDDPLQQLSVEDILRQAGYEVVSASDAASAFAAITETSNIVGLVTDIQLGGEKTGWDVARHAREMNSSLPVVYMTGDSAHEWAAQGVPNSIVLAKPFAAAQLVTAISQLLNNLGPDLA